MSNTFETTASFPSKGEALAHLQAFGYEAMPLRNRWTNRGFGDDGERRIGFASIAAIESNGRVTHYEVYETDMPLKRG